MSVTCDKYIGYTIDITKKWVEAVRNAKEHGVEDSFVDKWVGNFSFGHEEEKLFSDFNFLGYYNLRASGKSFKSRITLLDDGMNGEFTKLIYVIEYAENTEEEESNILDAINGLIDKKRAIPFSVKGKLTKVYNEIFNTEHSTGDLDIHVEYMVFYH